MYIKLNCLLSTAIFSSSLFLTSAIDAKAELKDINQNISSDILEVEGSATLDWSEVINTKYQTWISAQSNSLFTPSDTGYKIIIDANTHKYRVSDIPLYQKPAHWSGNLSHIISISGQAVPDTIAYTLLQPIFTNSPPYPISLAETLGEGHPLHGKHTIFCGLHPGEQGPNQFNPVFSIPPSWASKLPAAYQILNAGDGHLPHRRHSIVSQQTNAADLADLRTYFNDGNPFLVASAYKDLKSAGVLSAQDFGDMLRIVGEKQRQNPKNEVYILQAALIMVTLSRNAQGEDVPYDFINVLEDYIQHTANSEQLRGVALAMMMEDDSVVLPALRSSSRYRKLWQAIDSRQQLFRTDTDADRYLGKILTLAGIRASS